MRKVFSLYFDGTTVQAARVGLSGSALTIQDARTFPHDELDDFLSQTKDKSFIVCCNPPTFHQDIVYLPPAAHRHYDSLVASEVGKLHPELSFFATAHGIVGQATIDSKEFNKVAAFSYPEEFLCAILATFGRHGKMVSRVYAAPYSIFRLISSGLTEPATAHLFIAPLPGEKLLLLSENSGLGFVRKIPSSGATLIAEDLQSVNMTLDHCLQSLRVRPVGAVVLDQEEGSGEPRPHLSAPLTRALPPSIDGLPGDLATKYLAPLAAALNFFEAPKAGDLRPFAYALFSRNKRMLAGVSCAMLLFSLLFAAFAVTKRMRIADLTLAVAAARTRLASCGAELAAFRKLDQEVNTLNQQAAPIRKQSPALSPAAALTSLPVSGSPEYVVKAISIREDAKALGIKIEGEILASGFGTAQAGFERICQRIGQTPGYTVVSALLNAKQKTFTIQARYSGTGAK